MIEHQGDRWFAYHRATEQEHAQHWKDRTRVGWYCVSLSRANTVVDPRFAAVWIWPEKPLPEQTQTHVDFDKIVAHVNGLPKGTVPTIIAACGGGPLDQWPRFTVVSEKGTGAFLAKPIMVHDELHAQCNTSRANGKILRWAAAYPTDHLSGLTAYAAIWVDNPGRVAWKCTQAMDVDEFQAEFDANDKGWVRPSVLVPTNEPPVNPVALKRRLVVGWSDSLVRRCLTFVVDIDDDKLSDLIKKNKTKGLLPIHIQSFGIGSGIRYALIVGSPDDVIDRGTVVTTGDPPPLPTPRTRYLGVSRKFQRHSDSYSVAPAMTTVLDPAVKEDMRSTGHRAAALALARNGDLVFAAGYTYGEEGLYPQTSSTDVFRVGSLSKVITAIAIHQLHENQALLDEKVPALLGRTFKDHKGQNIRVEHLLAHKGGLPKNAGVFFNENGTIANNDTMEYDRFVKAWLKKVHNIDEKFPIGWDMVLKYVAGQDDFLESEPGTASKYSNTGYDLLGEVVRKRTSDDLIDHVKNKIFNRVGIRLDVMSKAPRWAESENETDGEVRYHDSSLSTTITVASGSGKLVPSCYGVWNMARIRGSAAWVMSAPHYLRILSRFTLPAGSNPLFTNAATETKFIDLGGLAVTRGGKTWSKNGAAPGARAMSLFRSDGWSMVYLTNSDEGDASSDFTGDAARLEALLDWSWVGIAPDPNAWRKVYVTP